MMFTYTNEVSTPARTNSTGCRHCTPRTRSPTHTITAWTNPSATSSIQRPKYPCVAVKAPTPSVSTSSFKIAISTNPPTHRARLV